jgi:septal ring factor EnvC (AmiA/AmiB activator)
LFASGSVEELTEAARAMWANHDELSTMGKRARSLMEQRFSQKQRLAALLDIYADVGGRAPLEQL